MCIRDRVCDTAVKSVAKSGTLFTVYTTVGSFETDAVIIATGGKAGPQFGCAGDGYAVAASFGHRLVEPLSLIHILAVLYRS